MSDKLVVLVAAVGVESTVTTTSSEAVQLSHCCDGIVVLWMGLFLNSPSLELDVASYKYVWCQTN